MSGPIDPRTGLPFGSDRPTANSLQSRFQNLRLGNNNRHSNRYLPPASVSPPDPLAPARNFSVSLRDEAGRSGRWLHGPHGDIFEADGSGNEREDSSLSVSRSDPALRPPRQIVHDFSSGTRPLLAPRSTLATVQLAAPPRDAIFSPQPAPPHTDDRIASGLREIRQANGSRAPPRPPPRSASMISSSRATAGSLTTHPLPRMEIAFPVRGRASEGELDEARRQISSLPTPLGDGSVASSRRFGATPAAGGVLEHAQQQFRDYLLEIRRRMAEDPAGSTAVAVAIATTPAPPPQPPLPAQADRKAWIEGMIKENESPAPPMSRACGICFAKSPRLRAVFVACGHVVCRACAEQLKDDAEEDRKKLICPFCRAETAFVPLFEDPVEIKLAED